MDRQASVQAPSSTADLLPVSLHPASLGCNGREAKGEAEAWPWSQPFPFGSSQPMESQGAPGLQESLQPQRHLAGERPCRFRMSPHLESRSSFGITSLSTLATRAGPIQDFFLNQVRGPGAPEHVALAAQTHHALAAAATYPSSQMLVRGDPGNLPLSSLSF